MRHDIIEQEEGCDSEIYIPRGAFKFALGVIHSELSQVVVRQSESKWIAFGDTLGLNG